MDNITISNLLSIYDKEISKNVKNKRKLYNFDVNKMQNISNIKRMLEDEALNNKFLNHFITCHYLSSPLQYYAFADFFHNSLIIHIAFLH